MRCKNPFGSRPIHCSIVHLSTLNIIAEDFTSAIYPIVILPHITYLLGFVIAGIIGISHLCRTAPCALNPIIFRLTGLHLGGIISFLYLFRIYPNSVSPIICYFCSLFIGVHESPCCTRCSGPIIVFVRIFCIFCGVSGSIIIIYLLNIIGPYFRRFQPFVSYLPQHFLCPIIEHGRIFCIAHPRAIRIRRIVSI